MITLKNKLKYLDDLLFSDGISQLKASFYGNKELLENGYDYYKEQDNYVKFDLVELENSESPEMVATIMNRTDFFELYLKQNQNSLYEYLQKTESNSNFSDDLNELYNYLNSYIKKATLLDVLFKDIINAYLTQIVQDLKIKYPIVESHRVFRVLNKKNGFLSYFQYKDIKASFFEDLYEVTYKLDLIDDVEVLEETFYEVFTTSVPNPEFKITFNTKNHLIAFFLKEIEQFFNNLNPVTIERSGCFYNKQGKKLNSTDLYTSLSRNIGKDSDKLNRISYHINELKKVHLK